MIPALNIAVSGMQDAANRLNGAAASTVRKSSGAAFGESVNQQADAGATTSTGRGTTGSLAQSSGAPMYIPSYAEDVVAMRQAVSAYKANAKMLRTVDDLAKSLIDSVNKR